MDPTYKRDGYKGLLQTVIRTYSSPSAQEYRPVRVAQSYVVLGDREQAFAWLDKAYDIRSGLDFVKVNPVWDPIRSDPRYADLLQRMGLP